ncbi:MAG TPA: cyclic nucleotide-binding domain-containing protein [Vicinamibacteria bacterium]|nr:cyclic nucleotide-binding domain-containing protein [Vicinamibacteria bacterium]
MAELVLQKKYKKALELLRLEFQKGNRSLELREQYADALAKSGETDKAVPVLLGLASELDAAGSHERATEMLRLADRIAPGRADVAARQKALATRASRRETALETSETQAKSPEPQAFSFASEPPPAPSRVAEVALTHSGADGETAVDATPVDAQTTAVDEVPVDESLVEASFADALPPIPAPPPLSLASEAEGQNDAVLLFGPALAPPNYASIEAGTFIEPEIPCEEFLPTGAEASSSPATLEAALAAVEATLALEEWQDDDATTADALGAESSHEASLADVLETSREPADFGQDALLEYVRDLASRFPSSSDDHPSASEFAGALLGGLSEDDLRAHLPGLARKDFDPGHVMVREGERGGGVFILSHGRARVLVQGEHSRPFEVAELSEGSFFGEVSLLSRPRSATVVAAGPCQVLEIAPETLEALAEGRPRVREIVEGTLVDRTNSAEVAAVRAVPPMDEAIPAQALRVLEAHFGATVKSSRMRLRLAELLARTGNYVDVVPVLVGLAEEMQAAGQPVRALAILMKIEAIDHQGPKEVGIAPLTRVPSRSGSEGPGSSVVSYVTTGQPTPSAEAAAQFRLWLQELMSESRETGASASVDALEDLVAGQSADPQTETLEGLVAGQDADSQIETLEGLVAGPDTDQETEPLEGLAPA